jgi:hypothetical protein
MKFKKTLSYSLQCTVYIVITFATLYFYLWGLFAKFIDSPYYSESELCGGVVMVSFSKYLPWQAMHFLQCSIQLLLNVLQIVDSFEIFLGAPFSWLEKLTNHMGRDLNWILCSAWKTWISGTPLEHLPYSLDLFPCDFWVFPTMKRELQGKKFQSDQRSAARLQEVDGAL